MSQNQSNENSRNRQDEKTPFISILIVNYNGLHHLQECLESIKLQSFSDYEVVLVDNASVDKSVDWLQINFPDVRVIRSNINLGFAGGNNLGLNYCKGTWVFLLNNDTVLDKEALPNLLTQIDQHSDINVFACLMVRYSNQDIVDSAGDNLYTSGTVINLSGYPITLIQEIREVTSACAGAAVYRRSVLKSLQGFDEDFFLLLEDVDLSLRARHQGERIFVLPKVKVYHKGSASIGGSLSATGIYYGMRNYLWLFIKNFPIGILVKVFPSLLLMLTIQIFQAISKKRIPVVLRALRDCMAKIPIMIKKRKAILSTSKISPTEFEQVILRGWLKSRIKYKMGGYPLPKSINGIQLKQNK